MKHEPELDDYSPENVSGATLFGGALIVLLIAMAIFFAIIQREPECHNVIDRETASIAVRPAIKTYTTTKWNEFYPGDTLTSKENGALMLWDSTMPRYLIVGYVTDSGTHELYYEQDTD